jgi:diguanylate cyclase (GGDEF)-like protein
MKPRSPQHHDVAQLEQLLNLQAPLFQGIDPALIQSWLPSTQLQRHTQGSELLIADQTNQHTFLLLSGQLHVILQEISTAPLAIIQPGHIVGEVSTLSREGTTAWVRAEQASEVLVIEREQLLAWAQQSHQLALNLLQLLGERLRHSNLHARGAQSLNQQLQTRALSDALTGALNRHWLDQHLESLRLCPELAVLMVDIDHFKAINDTHGHSCGDAVLRAVATTLRHALRPSDALVRLGGEEFLVICRQEASQAAAEGLGERLRQAVQHLQSDDLPPVTISIGVALRTPGEGWEAQLERADTALYRAKRNGRNRVELG